MGWKNFTLATACAALSLSVLAAAQDTDESATVKEPVVVAVHSGDAGGAAELQSLFYNKVVSLLAQHKLINVVDRDMLEAILGEQRISLSGFSNKLDIIRVGELDIAHFILDLKAGRFVNEVSLSATLADTSTGEITYQREFSGNFKDLGLPIYILCDNIATDITGLPLPKPDGVQIVHLVSGDLEPTVRVLSDGRERDGISYVQGEFVFVNGENIIIQLWVDEEFLFGFPLPSELVDFEVEFKELPPHRREAILLGIKMDKLPPMTEQAHAKYGLYGLMIFDMWVYGNMDQLSIALFMGMSSELIALFEEEFDDLEKRLYGEN